MIEPLNNMIIGISGKIGTGKSTLAKAMAGINGYSVASFGDCLKRGIAKTFNINLSLMYSEEGKDSYYRGSLATVRDILQWYGTDIVRERYPNYWVEKMQGTLKSLPFVIIDDVRFPNEAKICDTLIRINPYPGWSKQSFHPSENALDDYKFEHCYSPEFGKINELAHTIISELCLPRI